jgi:serine-type D-Ala-D-Ala carboxypeptidase/endopeptidase (penicillin-binding protein 4)
MYSSTFRLLRSVRTPLRLARYDFFTSSRLNVAARDAHCPANLPTILSMKKVVVSVLSLLILLAAPALAEELPPPVAQALRAAGIPASATSLLVQEVDSSWPRASVNARAVMNPASTMKLLTTFSALELLGPAYTWKTEALMSGALVDGVLTGDLHLRGGGDPRLTYDQFGRLLRQIRARGVREIRGDLVLDRTAFSVPESDAGRFDAQPTRPYNVVPDALLVNFKSITLRLMPADDAKSVSVYSEPAPANLDITNLIKLSINGNGGNGSADCGDWRERLRADLFVHGPITRLVLTGNYPVVCAEQRWNIAVQDHPAFVFGVFRQLWIELGGTISGGVRDAVVPGTARSLAVLPSPTLSEVVRDINKFSNNVMARQLFLTLGLEASKRPSRAEDADAAVRGWLEARGLKNSGAGARKWLGLIAPRTHLGRESGPGAAGGVEKCRDVGADGLAAGHRHRRYHAQAA